MGTKNNWENNLLNTHVIMYHEWCKNNGYTFYKNGGLVIPGKIIKIMRKWSIAKRVFWSQYHIQKINRHNTTKKQRKNLKETNTTEEPIKYWNQFLINFIFREIEMQQESQEKNQQVYGQEFLVWPASVYPTKAKIWKNTQAALDDFIEWLVDCNRHGQTPADAWLYIGEPDGDEEKYGYPDYPDFILGIDKNNPENVKLVKV